jgi:hypothetical protein
LGPTPRQTPFSPGASRYGPDQQALEELAKSILRGTPQESRRLSRAAEEFDKGNIAVAYRLYISVASSRQPSENQKVAKDRLEIIRKQGKEKCEEIDARLDDLVRRMNNISEPAETPAAPEEVIVEIFKDYKELLKQYRQVAVFGSWLSNHVAKQRVRPECAAVLNEPQAAELLKIGQSQEQKNQLCCAYRSYEKALKLLPAPSAQTAQNRFLKMKENPQIVESAKTCAELEWCHKSYDRAKKIKDKNPERAQELFSQIVDRSPADSTVHRAAADRLHEYK